MQGAPGATHNPGRRALWPDPDQTRRAGAERVEVDAVGGVGALVVLGDAVVGQHGAQGGVEGVRVAGPAQGGPHQVDLGRRFAQGSVLEDVDARRQCGGPGWLGRPCP